MRLALLSLIVISFTYTAYCQHFTDNGNTWLLQEVNWELETGKDFMMKIKGDTLINNLIYKTVIRTEEPGGSNWSQQNFYLRETDEGIVYVLFGTGLEGVLYHFGLQVGQKVELWNGFTATLQAVETIVAANNDVRNKFQMQLEQPGFCTTGTNWIDGIGATGPWPIDFCFDLSYGLTCFFHDDAFYYGDTDFCQQFITSTGEPDAINMEIYPNPATDILNIRFQDDSAKSNKIQVYNLQGQLLYQNITRENLHKVDVSHLTSGVFILQISSQDGGLLSRKIVKL
jgi:hypothetical protein